MRIVIDMQGAQTTGSRTRGIGRYTLALVEAMVRAGRDHQFVLALNGLFPDTLQPLREQFAPLVGADNIKVWTSPSPVHDLDPENARRRDAAEAIRETFIANLQPDAILLTSLFEGLGDSALCSTARTRQMAPTAVILYDLIPYMQKAHYLSHRPVELWYERKLQQLRLANLQLAISGAARADSQSWLGTRASAVVNISAAADAMFSPDPDPDGGERFAEVRARYGVNRGVVMYTGGIDLRKNIPALLQAFAALPDPLRSSHQLVIVCSVKPHEVQDLRAQADQLGLASDELVITGFVPEHDLVAFYRYCALFVFPSKMEGFGLPMLEAMQCGAPVIGSNASAMPEVIGRSDALFDPHSVSSITDKMAQVLSDPEFAAELRRHGLERSQTFSWQKSASLALDAIEKMVRDAYLAAPTLTRRPRPRLAFVSPLPPLQSGIANYAAELLPDLSLQYDIELITDQQELSSAALAATMPVKSYSEFLARPDRYDRVLYQMGNSAFHIDMFEALPQVPGVLVLHDFFLSGAHHYREAAGKGGDFWADLYRAHGYPALAARGATNSVEKVIGKYPVNQAIFANARGIIVHSRHAASLAAEWCGRFPPGLLSQIPHSRKVPQLPDRHAARARLGLDQTTFLVSSFGYPARTKLNLETIAAFAASEAAAAGACFILAGNLEGHYKQEVEEFVRQKGISNRVMSTGWIDSSTYADYLAAVDVVVQLRGETRGESSGAVLDAMAAGRCLVVNALGSMGELPPTCVTMLPEQFDPEQLTSVIDEHWRDSHRDEQGARARRYVAAELSSGKVAAAYVDAIENFYNQPWPTVATAAAAAVQLDAIGNNEDAVGFARAVARTFPPFGTHPQLFVDVTTLLNAGNEQEVQRLRALLMTQTGLRRVEPIFRDRAGDLRYARSFAVGLLTGAKLSLPDAPIDIYPGDVFLTALPPQTAGGKEAVDFLRADVAIVASFADIKAFEGTP